MQFARLFSMVTRSCYCLHVGHRLWIYSYANDLDIVGMGSTAMETILSAPLFMTICRVPLAGRKSHDGIAYSWIGHYQDWDQLK